MSENAASQAMVVTNQTEFVERRNSSNGPTTIRERRQFANGHDGLSTEARELALAIDRYKLDHRRRFITHEEMVSVIQSLGYRKTNQQATA